MFRLLIVILSLLSLTSEGEEKAAQLVKMHNSLDGSCSYQMLDSVRNDTQAVCAISALSERCNKIDDCYSYCLSQNIGADVGGGCGHLCNYANQDEWQPPKNILSCKDVSD